MEWDALGKCDPLLAPRRCLETSPAPRRAAQQLQPWESARKHHCRCRHCHWRWSPPWFARALPSPHLLQPGPWWSPLFCVMGTIRDENAEEVPWRGLREIRCGLDTWSWLTVGGQANGQPFDLEKFGHWCWAYRSLQPCHCYSLMYYIHCVVKLIMSQHCFTNGQSTLNVSLPRSFTLRKQFRLPVFFQTNIVRKTGQFSNHGELSWI